MVEHLFLWAASQLCLKDHLVFSCHAVWMYVCMYVCVDVGFSSTIKVNLRFSYENAMTDFRITWYVDSWGHKYYPRGLSSLNTHIKYLICISVLIG